MLYLLLYLCLGQRLRAPQQMVFNAINKMVREVLNMQKHMGDLEVGTAGVLTAATKHALACSNLGSIWQALTFAFQTNCCCGSSGSIATFRPSAQQSNRATEYIQCCVVGVRVNESQLLV